MGECLNKVFELTLITFAAAAAPLLWNSLPSHIRQPDLSQCPSYGQFRQSLKTFLFGH